MLSISSLLFQDCLRGFVFLLLLTYSPTAVLVAAQQQQQQQETPDPSTIGCFDYRNLTCSVPLDQGDPNIDVNLTCLTMEDHIYNATGEAVRLVKSDQDTYKYQQQLNFLTQADDLCYGAHNAYHKCWWCSAAQQQQEETPDPSTIGCFDYRNLTCNVPLDQGDPNIDVNLACLTMEGYIYGATDEAVRLVKSDQDTYKYQQQLNFLTQADHLCYGAHNAYHKCRWCAANVSDSFCKFETCEKPSNSSNIEEVNVTATCEEMRQLHDAYDGKAYPATIEFCHRAEASAYACPDLYCGK